MHCSSAVLSRRLDGWSVPASCECSVAGPRLQMRAAAGVFDGRRRPDNGRGGNEAFVSQQSVAVTRENCAIWSSKQPHNEHPDTHHVRVWSVLTGHLASTGLTQASSPVVRPRCDGVLCGGGDWRVCYRAGHIGQPSGNCAHSSAQPTEAQYGHYTIVYGLASVPSIRPSIVDIRPCCHIDSATPRQSAPRQCPAPCPPHCPPPFKAQARLPLLHFNLGSLPFSVPFGARTRQRQHQRHPCFPSHSITRPLLIDQVHRHQPTIHAPHAWAPPSSGRRTPTLTPTPTTGRRAIPVCWASMTRKHSMITSLLLVAAAAMVVEGRRPIPSPPQRQ